MNIPPIPPSGSPPPGSMPNSLVQHLYTLWDNWYLDNDPKDQVRNGMALLQFLQKNHAYLEQLAKKNPRSEPVSFANSYSAAINSLNEWLQHGAPTNNKAPVSEFVGDVYDWIAYVNQ